MRAAVVLRSGLPFAVGLDDEPSKIGNERIDVVHFLPPPPCDRRVERIVGGQAAQHLGRREIGGQIHADAIGPEDASDGRGFLEKRLGERLRVRVDAVDDGAVDADRRVGAGVIHETPIDAIRPPQRASGVAALDGAIEIVPVVEQPALQPWTLDDVEACKRHTV
jgi:hypothetical protein